MRTTDADKSELHDAVQPISGIAEAGKDVADLVQPLVQAGQHEGAGYVQLVKQLVQPGDPFWSRNQADASDVISAALYEELHRRGERAASGEHRIEDVALSPGQIMWQPFRVGGGQQRLLVADHADEPNLSRRNQ